MSAAHAAAALPAEELARRLEAFLAEPAGAAPGAVRVEGLRPMAGGASRELWSLDVAIQGRPRLALVLRRDPPGRVGDSSDRGLEFALLRAAEEAGVPVPRVHWSCGDPAILGSSFFLMDRVPGETIPRRLLRDEEYAGARRVMTCQLGAILARIHAVDPDGPELAGLDVAGQGGTAARQEVERVTADLRGEWERLAALLDEDAAPPAGRQALREGVRTRTAELVRRIRAGQADVGPWRAKVLAHLRRSVADKLAVSLPPRSGGG